MFWQEGRFMQPFDSLYVLVQMAAKYETNTY